MTDDFQNTLMAAAELHHLLSEIDEYRLQPETFPTFNQMPGYILNHSRPEEDVLDEIPRDERTYRDLSTALIPHTRFSNMYLLEFRTFSGALAYQPCSKDIDLIGVFKALRPLERSNDTIFKDARVWSCIMQATPGLPKDVRFVLATIYDFTNEILRSRHSEHSLWQYRSWLYWWYSIADQLFDRYRINATSPDPDWFMRPTEVSSNYTATERVAIASRFHRSSGVSQSEVNFGNSHSPSNGFNSTSSSSSIHSAPEPAYIQRWLDANPTVPNTNTTYGQHLPQSSSRAVIVTSQHNQDTRPSQSGLNPLAASYIPVTRLRPEDNEIEEMRHSRGFSFDSGFCE